MLINEVKRRHAHEIYFFRTFENIIQNLAPVFDRMPRFTTVLQTCKMLVQYTQRQYTSTLGPFEGGLHFHHDVNASLLKSMAFSRVFSNALTGRELGAAAGSADFNPLNKSEAKIQRFCQATMTELANHIGPDQAAYTRVLLGSRAFRPKGA